uniref:protein BTG1-like n=1 Tax=Arvicanthis niloticus TaxID=61156 RepID=UPI00148747ED|nr:protein BTG1-like [Arvicanthis niloticus]
MIGKITAAAVSFISKFLGTKGLNHKMDDWTGSSAAWTESEELFRFLPSELTLWVVFYRIGEDGSICVLYEAGGSTQNNTNGKMVDSRISCKEELRLGRTSPSKKYNIMTVY